MEELQEALLNRQEDLRRFKNQIINKHVIVYLGNTRSGKSTLVNYLIGTPLIAFEDRHPIYKIKKVNDDDEGPQIGQGSLSTTATPEVYQVPDFGVIVDAPGFDDNRSLTHDIINALYINQIKHAKTIKFVLVSDINDLLTDNISGLINLLQKVHTLLFNIHNLCMSISIIFTKDLRNYTPSTLASIMQNKILDVKGLQVNKSLINNFVNYHDLIGIFKMPSSVGIIGEELNYNIYESRLASIAFPVYENFIHIAISGNAELLLLEFFQTFLDTSFFERQARRILRQLKSYFDINDYVFASTNNELRDTKENLSNIQSRYNNKLHISVENIREIQQFFTESSEELNWLVNLDEASLIEEGIKRQLISKFKLSLQKVISQAKFLLSKIDKELTDRKNVKDTINASATVASTSGAATALAEGARKVSSMSPWFPIVGVAITAIAAGVAVTSYVIKSSDNDKRIEARKNQGRHVYKGMFSED